MNIVISSGHGKYVRGASGYIDEVDEARKVVETVAEYLRSAGVNVKTFHDNTSTSQNQNLNTIVNYHNAQSRDLDVSVHFNAYSTTSKPMGVEVLYVTQSSLASKTSQAIANAGHFINRGGKKRTDLFFLNSTEMPAILIETCFVDSKADTDLYHQHYGAICEAIAETIGGVEIPEAPVEPEEPPPVEPPEVSGDNRVDLVGIIEGVEGTEGHVTIFVNDELLIGHENCEHTLRLSITKVGDVTVTINGQEFHNYPAEPTEPEEPEEGPQANHTDIEATVFGGSSDPNNSAYPPYEYLDDTDLYVALPYSFSFDYYPDNPPKVRVFNRANESSAVGDVMDKGPWTTDDTPYVKGTARPIAESCFKDKRPLPSGPNKGKVPTNAAGIDLSPALAKKIGISGKGKVNWEFE